MAPVGNLVIALLLLAYNVNALGERGAMERVVYYGSYLAEGILNDYFDYGADTMFPGCTGSAEGGRCTMLEACQYIWKGSDEQIEAGVPKPSKRGGPLDDVKTDSKFTSRGFDNLAENVKSWSQKPIPALEKVDGRYRMIPDGKGYKMAETGVYKIDRYNYQSLTVRDSEDWYDGLAKSTRPIAILRGKLAEARARLEGPLPKALTAKRILALERFCQTVESATYRVVELRRLEFEHGPHPIKGPRRPTDPLPTTERPLSGRIPAMERFVREQLGVPDDDPAIIQEADDPLLSGTKKPNVQFTILDVATTISKNSAKYPNIEEVLLSAMQSYVTSGSANEEHLRALQAAERAVQGCKCMSS